MHCALHSCFYTCDESTLPRWIDWQGQIQDLVVHKGTTSILAFYVEKGKQEFNACDAKLDSGGVREDKFFSTGRGEVTGI